MTTANRFQTPVRLSVSNVVIHAFVMPWRNRRDFLRALWAPGIAIFVLTLFPYFYSESPPEPIRWILYLGYLVLFTLFAVSCHRVVLLGREANVRFVRWNWSMRETRFLAWTGGVWVAFAACWLLAISLFAPIFMNLFGVSGQAPGQGAVSLAIGGLGWPEIIGTIPASYVWARLSLLLPATAIDKKPNFRWAWAASRGNGWRLVVVVGMLPLALEDLVSLIDSNLDLAFADRVVVFVLLSVVTLTITITTLSLSYKALNADVDPKGS